MTKSFTIEQAKEIGEKLGINWSKFDVEQFRIGMCVELEHGTIDPNTNVSNDDPLATGKIALAHLNELPDYYTRLLEMEEQGEKYWKNNSEKHETPERIKELAKKEGF
jgi:hypothetical protein